MEKATLKGKYKARCFGPDGNEKWSTKGENLLTNEGLNYILNNGMGASLYLGLKNTGTPALTDTLASHAGWTENTNYADNRKLWGKQAATSQAMTNAASVATFTLNAAGQTIYGAMLTTAASGTTGSLISVGDFDGGPKSGGIGDRVEVTYILEAANA